MKIDEIKTIVKLMSDHDLSEFKIEAEDMHLCIRRGSTTAQQILAPAPLMSPAVAAPAPVPAPAAAPDSGTSGDSSEVHDEKNAITSPIVGTFYRSPAPDADPFVEVGATVNPDTVVCIIEAMKVMNEIKAEKSGVIKKILVDNAEPVEYGQPLFVIE